MLRREYGSSPRRRPRSGSTEIHALLTRDPQTPLSACGEGPGGEVPRRGAGGEVFRARLPSGTFAGTGTRTGERNRGQPVPRSSASLTRGGAVLAAHRFE